MVKGYVKAFGKGFLKTAGAVAGVGALTTPVWAFSINPPEGSFFYNIYELLVDRIIQGPIGTAGGVAAMAYGGIKLILGQWSQALFPILGGAVLVKAEDLAQSVGMTINGI